MTDAERVAALPFRLADLSARLARCPDLDTLVGTTLGGLAELFGDIRDPDLNGVSVTITQIKPSPDMRHAAVFCEPLGGQNAKQVIAALNKHKGYLRGEMGREIAMKFTPELRFVEDESFAEAQKIDDLLRSSRVARDLAADDEDEK